MCRAVALSGLLFLQAAVLGAQQYTAPFGSWTAPVGVDRPAHSAGSLGLASAQGARRDYRYEGLLVGGLTFGALGAWIGASLRDACPTDAGGSCERDHLGDAVALGLTGAAIGGGLGYLVGLLSPKHEPAVGE